MKNGFWEYAEDDEAGPENAEGDGPGPGRAGGAHC